MHRWLRRPSAFSSASVRLQWHLDEVSMDVVRIKHRRQISREPARSLHELTYTILTDTQDILKRMLK